MGGGLAAMDAEGDLIVYSTGAGDVASDNQSGGDGALHDPPAAGVEAGAGRVEEAFDRTRAAVV